MMHPKDHEFNAKYCAEAARAYTERGEPDEAAEYGRRSMWHTQMADKYYAMIAAGTLTMPEPLESDKYRSRPLKEEPNATS